MQPRVVKVGSAGIAPPIVSNQRFVAIRMGDAPPVDPRKRPGTRIGLGDQQKRDALLWQVWLALGAKGNSLLNYATDFDASTAFGLLVDLVPFANGGKPLWGLDQLSKLGNSSKHRSHPPRHIRGQMHPHPRGPFQSHVVLVIGAGV